MTRFPQEIGSVSLASMIQHAREILRTTEGSWASEVLDRYPRIRLLAGNLAGAAALGAPESDLTGHAHALNNALKYANADRQKRRPPGTEKPGNKARDVAKVAREKKEAADAARPANIVFTPPADSLWGGL